MSDYSEFKPVYMPRTLTEADTQYDAADLSDAQRAPYENVRERLDRALQVAGVHPVAPQRGQSVDDYRRTLLGHLTSHTESHRRLDVKSVYKADNLDYYEKRIAAEAIAEPARMGTLREVKAKDQTGRVWTEFEGDMRAWMQEFQKVPGESPIYVDGQPKAAPVFY